MSLVPTEPEISELGDAHPGPVAWLPPGFIGVRTPLRSNWSIHNLEKYLLVRSVGELVLLQV